MPDRATPDPAADRHPRDRLRPVLGLPDAVLLIVSSVVGSGIFLTPGRIADLVPHAGAILAVWLLGGLLSLGGALANAELGAMFPRAGGDYVYLREAFHPLAGFLVGWLSFFVIFVGTIATLAAGFAAGLAPWLGYGEAGELVVAVAVTLAVSLLNYAGVRWGALANNLTAAVKILALGAFVVAGPWLGQGSWEHLRPLVSEAGGRVTAGAFLMAFSPILFSYLGWNSSVYVASEIRDPARNVPRSLFVGLALCTGTYLLVNAVYLFALPLDALGGVDNAGEAAARALFGGVGGGLVAGFVLASILGTLNATVLLGPRIAYAMALDGLFFRRVDEAHPIYGTPHVAIGLQAAVTVALLGVLAAFPSSLFVSALDYTTFAILLAALADVAALYRLRRTQPHRPRPYRAWGYPVVPGLYMAASGVISVALMAGQPGEAALVGVMVATGLPFYALFRRRLPGPG